MSIGVLGAGAWGTALASRLADGQQEVLLWGRDRQVIDEINSQRRNRAYTGEIVLSSALLATDDISKACMASTVLCVTPAQSFSGLVEIVVPMLSASTKLVLCAKGIDRASGRPLHSIAADGVGKYRVAALSGPSFASDVAQGLPTAVALAAETLDDAKILAAQLSRPGFRLYASDDLFGVELGGALKNVLAIAVGVVRGLGLGASAEAALIARGFAELNRVAVAGGARPKTLSGLSGLGDLVLTCSSPKSRNFSYGIALAKGENLAERPLAEGVHTADMALGLAQKFNVEAPIVATVVEVLNGKLSALEAVNSLMSRPLKVET